MPLLNQAFLSFGKVFHKRFGDKTNSFNYRVFSLRIPMRSRRLDPDLLTQVGIGDNHFKWLSFYDKDHGNGGDDALAWAEGILKESGIDTVNGEIWLHTFPRVLGYVFNPVSFWFCHDANDRLLAILAEVNNTFGERHTYVVKPQGPKDDIAYGEKLSASKLFHVSPFYDVDGYYIFQFMRRALTNQPTQHLSKIDYFTDNALALSTSISGTEFPITSAMRYKAIFDFPWMTLGIIFKIHWQALILWIKGVKFYKKPAPPANSKS